MPIHFLPLLIKGALLAAGAWHRRRRSEPSSPANRPVLWSVPPSELGRFTQAHPEGVPASQLIAELRATNPQMAANLAAEAGRVQAERPGCIIMVANE